MRKIITIFFFVYLILTAPNANAGSFDDSGWVVQYRENFNDTYVAADGQTFGQDSWLIYQLINDGEIVVADGYAQLNAPDFWNAALIRSTEILPEEYKIRTKIGYIEYDLTNYEQEDYNHPDFNDHGGYYENGVYWLTITDDSCVSNECAELWWHYHRKMVIDVDNHLNYGGDGETFHPVYMVYMAPETNSGGNLLRTWTGSYWDTSPWNWNVAYTYEYDTWYYAELEKKDSHIILRIYDSDKNIIEETTPVDLSLVNAMNDSLEFLYIGEPHTDDYEGSARFDEITLLVPSSYICGDVEKDGEVNLLDITFFINYMYRGGPAPEPIISGDIDGNGVINLLDITSLIRFLYHGGPDPVCE